MHFEPNHIYHVYNRGNNKTPIFFNDENYFYLLGKIRNEWLKYCDALCYCLMPNHFHFMLMPNNEGCDSITLNQRATAIQRLSKAIGKTLSSYTQAINLQNKTTGNLFQKKTKAKCLTDLPIDNTGFPATEYLLNCFHYIHLNPLEANLVSHLNDWPFSSWLDYCQLRNDNLCDTEKTIQLLGISDVKAFTNSFAADERILKQIW